MCMMREKTHSSLLSCFFIFQVILQHISFSHFFSFLFFLIHILFSLSFPPPSTSSITSYGISVYLTFFSMQSPQNGAIRFLQQFLYYNQSPIIKLSYHIQKQLRLFQYYCSLFHTSLLGVDFPTSTNPSFFMNIFRFFRFMDSSLCFAYRCRSIRVFILKFAIKIRISLPFSWPAF